MRTVKTEMDKLPNDKRQQLMYAFESGIPQYVELSDGWFIGVNIIDLKQLEVIDTAGAWSIGHIKQPV